MLTNPVLDPFGKIPEFKYCAVKVSKGGPKPQRMSFRRGACCRNSKLNRLKQPCGNGISIRSL
jgi:hypothetical protein